MLTDITVMATDLSSMSAEQQLWLKVRSMMVMFPLGGIVGLLLRRVFRAILGNEFIEHSPSGRSPLDPE